MIIDINEIKLESMEIKPVEIDSTTKSFLNYLKEICNSYCWTTTNSKHDDDFIECNLVNRSRENISNDNCVAITPQENNRSNRSYKKKPNNQWISVKETKIVKFDKVNLTHWRKIHPHPNTIPQKTILVNSFHFNGNSQVIEKGEPTVLIRENPDYKFNKYLSKEQKRSNLAEFRNSITYNKIPENYKVLCKCKMRNIH